MTNYYEILGVPETATEPEIKKAYRKLATEWHPDKHQGKETLTEADVKFKSISEAYSILSDAAQRQRYDQERRGGGAFQFHTTGDPFDFVADYFRFGGIKNAHQQRHSTVTGQSLQFAIVLSLAEAMLGTTKHLTYKIGSACEPCQGKGAEEFVKCGVCDGHGVQTRNMGKAYFQSTCPGCLGAGEIAKTRCPACDGKRVIQEERSINAQIPPNTPHKSHLRFGGAGGKGSPGMPTGDLVLEIVVRYPDLSKLTEEEKETLKSLLTKE